MEYLSKETYSSVLPADPLLNRAVNDVLRAYEVTGWRPTRSSARPRIIAVRATHPGYEPDWKAIKKWIKAIEPSWSRSDVSRAANALEKTWKGTGNPSYFTRWQYEQPVFTINCLPKGYSYGRQCAGMYKLLTECPLLQDVPLLFVAYRFPDQGM